MPALNTMKMPPAPLCMHCGATMAPYGFTSDTPTVPVDGGYYVGQVVAGRSLVFIMWHCLPCSP